jgi:hypothetical protein
MYAPALFTCSVIRVGHYMVWMLNSCRSNSGYAHVNVLFKCMQVLLQVAAAVQQLTLIVFFLCSSLQLSTAAGGSSCSSAKCS